MHRFLAFTFVALILLHPCSAIELARYTFTGGSSASTDTDAATSAGAFSFGPAGTAATPNWGFSTQQDNVFARGHTTPGTEALAVSTGSYFTFTLTPVTLGAGDAINLTSLTFDTISNNATGVSGSNNATFFVRSSLDGYTANLQAPHSQSFNTTSTPNPQSQFIDLTAFQGIVSSITFRIYVFDDTTNENRTPRLDNVILTGDIIPIPEPAAATLLTGAAFLAIIVKRRKRHHAMK